MSGLDRHKLPAEDDIQGTELNVPEPLFCTQAVCEEIVEESPDNDTAEKVEDGGNSDVHSARGDKFDYVPPPAPGGNHEIPSNIVPTATSADPNLAYEGADGVPLNEEVASSPQEPFLGMRFDTIVDARAHYNAYAKKLGFSIKSNTSHRQAFTNELRKQAFVCNKNRQPKTEEEKQKEKMNVVEEVSPIQIDDDNEEGRQSGHAKKSTSSKLGVRRKRESIKQTKCEAKMIVKLVNNKWEVTYFIPEHNHPMVVKPSLSKYLRSHKGIPADEKAFLKCLHDCNLETGRMMTAMSSFYGAEAFVPYALKDITNLRTSFRSENKEWDMSETVAYFAEIKEKDPGFYSNFSFDEESRVENIFWVDSVARKAYTKAYHDCVSFDTTFMTNHFNMPFAPFIGINRHGRTFTLGCGFLRDEKEESFKWLFREFLKAMHGKQPSNIITDQDWAMRLAISAIFPKTSHRNCR